MYTQRKKRLDPITTLFLLFFFLFLPLSVHAGLRVIESIDPLPDRDPGGILIRFRVPVTLRSHAPRKRGDLLQIQLNPLPGKDRNGDKMEFRERYPWHPTEKLPVTEVSWRKGAEVPGSSFILQGPFPIQSPLHRTLAASWSN